VEMGKGMEEEGSEVLHRAAHATPPAAAYLSPGAQLHTFPVVCSSSASLETGRRSGVSEEERGGGTEDKVEQKRWAWG
jgi:hypothetical protein